MEEARKGMHELFEIKSGMGFVMLLGNASFVCLGSSLPYAIAENACNVIYVNSQSVLMVSLTDCKKGGIIK